MEHYIAWVPRTVCLNHRTLYSCAANVGRALTSACDSPKALQVMNHKKNIVPFQQLRRVALYGCIALNLQVAFWTNGAWRANLNIGMNDAVL